MAFLGDVGEVEAHFCLFRNIVNFNADRCIVFAKSAIGSEVILGALDGTPR